MQPITVSEYSARRSRLMAALGEGSIALIPAASLRYRNRDAEYAFRQDSDFLYLSGFHEPDALLLLLAGENGSQSILFCPPRDPAQEIWNGYRAGPQGAISQFGMDQAYSLDEIDRELPKLLRNRQVIYYPFNDTALNGRIERWRKQLFASTRDGQCVPDTLKNLGSVLHGMRLIKSPAEQALMRASGELSAQGHCRAMQSCRPGMMEYQLEAEIQHQFSSRGSRAPAYGTIVGGGANGCILHYTQNRDQLRDGDLVLIDAGCELDGYAGDITRTFPVNGCFSDDQKALYEVVLAAQMAAIEAVTPGQSWNLPHERAVEVLTQGLIDLGLLQGELTELIAQEAYKPFYMHRTGHWLGLDVHDVGEYRQGDDWRPLQAGMVLTVEPGLYIAPDNELVEPRWRGIGIRIEDDVLVTESGCEVLSAGVPKTVTEIEALMAGGAS